MKFSFKSKVDINQDLQIVVPNKDIQEQVLIKLRAAQKDSKLKGFRKGKAPLNIVKKKYEDNVLNEVIQKVIDTNTKQLIDEKKFELLGEIYKKQNSWAAGSDINKINDSIN